MANNLVVTNLGRYIPEEVKIIICDRKSAAETFTEGFW